MSKRLSVDEVLVTELLQAIRQLSETSTDAASLLRGLSYNNVLESGLALIPSGGILTRSYMVPFGSVAIANHGTGDMTVTAAPAAEQAPRQGRGVFLVRAGGSRTVNLAGTALAVYGTAGDALTLQVFSKGQPPFDSAGSTDAPVPLPADQGLVAWSSDPSGSSATTLLVNGTLYLIKAQVRKPTLTTGASLLLVTAGATPVIGQNFAAAYSPAGLLLGSGSGDVAFYGATGEVLVPFAAPQVVPAGGYWVAILANAVTPPTFRSGPATTAGANVHGVGATLRYATNGAGLTALPGSISPAANVPTGVTWAGLY